MWASARALHTQSHVRRTQARWPAATRMVGREAVREGDGVMLSAGKRLAVFSIREGRGGSIWVRAGSAFVNKDGSLNVLLDVLPLDGKLHVREAAEKRDTAAGSRFGGGESSLEAGVEGHS